MTDFCAIILAGGKSSRMGQKKATLLLGGKTFLQIIEEKLLSVGARQILLSGYECRMESMICVPDVIKEKGPLGGIHAGLLHSEYERAIVITEDAPLIPDFFLEGLIRAHEKGTAPVTATRCSARIQPLVGIYNKELIPVCEELLSGGRPGPMALIERAGAAFLDFEGDELLVRGCNTPQEYERLQMLYHDTSKWRKLS